MLVENRLNRTKTTAHMNGIHQHTRRFAIQLTAKFFQLGCELIGEGLNIATAKYAHTQIATALHQLKFAASAEHFYLIATGQTFGESRRLHQLEKAIFQLAHMELFYDGFTVRTHAGKKFYYL